MYLYSSYLTEKYGAKAYRVSIDAGFSCPNRNSREQGGCIYCDASGSRAPYLGDIEGVGEQLLRAVAFLRKRYKAEVFLLYFQAYTGTYAPPDRLRRLYDHCLGLVECRELIVSTRPDCLDEEKADLLASYKKDEFDVWVELGLQSAHEQTLLRIKRGHSVAQFEEAFRILRNRGIKIAVHVIFGLPGEGMKEILETVSFIAQLKPDGIKIHNLHVPYSSALFGELECGELTIPCEQRHRDYVIAALERLPEQTIIMRLLCDTPKARLAVPNHWYNKALFYADVKKTMEARGTWQGRLKSEVHSIAKLE